MCYDLPRIEYAKTDKEGNVIKKKDASYDEVAAANEAIFERMRAKKIVASEVQKISLTNLLEGK